MTVQEAIGILKKPIEYAKISNIDNEEEIAYSTDFVKSIEIAIESMEKQIPKKVIRQKGECYGMTKDGKAYHEQLLLCPNCHRAIKRTEALDVHCKYCGQAIDWEEGGTSD